MVQGGFGGLHGVDLRWINEPPSLHHDALHFPSANNFGHKKTAHRAVFRNARLKQIQLHEIATPAHRFRFFVWHYWHQNWLNRFVNLRHCIK